MMNAHLYKNLPPEGHLESLGRASDQQDLKSPSLILSARLCPCQQAIKGDKIMRKGGGSKGCIPLLLTSSAFLQVVSNYGSKTDDWTEQWFLPPSPGLSDHHCSHLYCPLSLTPAPRQPLEVSCWSPCLKSLPCVLMSLECKRDGFKFRVQHILADSRKAIQPLWPLFPHLGSGNNKISLLPRVHGKI